MAAPDSASASSASVKDDVASDGTHSLQPPANSSSIASQSTTSIGKRSRSNSSSSQSSSASSSGASSVFSRPGFALESSYGGFSSALSLTSCSSVSSSPEAASPQSKVFDDCGEQRPCKTQKTKGDDTACQNSSCSSTSKHLVTAVEACKLGSLEPPAQPVLTQLREPSPSSLAASGSKTLLVDGLVDATVHVLDCIWYAPATAPVCKLLCYHGNDTCTCDEQRDDSDAAELLSKLQSFKQNDPCDMTCGLPLDLFVRETLRRSRTSCSTLQAALLYILRIAAKARQARLDKASSPYICPRRMFLAAILTSSKFLQDRTYSNKAWSRISGLPVPELSHLERSFLKGIDFSLYVKDEEWQSLTTWLRDGIAARSGSAGRSDAGLVGRKGLERTHSEVIVGTSWDRSEPKNVFTLDCQIPEPSMPDSPPEVSASQGHNLLAAAILGNRHSRMTSNDSTPTVCASPASLHSNGTPTLEPKRSVDVPLAFPLRRHQQQRTQRNGGLRAGRSVSSNIVHGIRL